MKTTTACFMGILASATAIAVADRGRGSIRAAGGPGRVEQRSEPVRVQPDEHHDVRPEAPRPPEIPHQIESPHEPPHVVTPPRSDVPVHRDWDDNDEDPRHFGGFSQGVPGHIDRGARFRDLPARHFDLLFNNLHYFLDDTGAYYLQQGDGQYVVVQPPIGVLAGSLPDAAVPIVAGPTTYYYLDGVFYIAQGSGFIVVNPPTGIVVPTLPSDANQVVLNGSVAYQFNGFYYEPSIQDGVTVYTVVPV